MNNRPKQNQKEDIQASPDSERSVRDLIRAISCREIVLRTLDANLRQACVEELTLEGLTTGQIADQLNTSDRTVRRYLQDIRRANALDRNPETVKQAVGGLVREAEIAITRIRVASNRPQAKVADRIDAEHRCWSIRRGLTEMLQRLGYLPIAAVKFSGGLRHSVSIRPPSNDEMLAELNRLESIETKFGSDERRLARIAQIRNIVLEQGSAGQIEQSSIESKEKTNESQ